MSDVSGRARERVHDVVERVEDALESAGADARKAARRAEKQIRRGVREADRLSRENVYWLALGALGVGIAVGYLIGRDNKKSLVERITG